MVDFDIIHIIHEAAGFDLRRRLETAMGWPHTFRRLPKRPLSSLHQLRWPQPSHPHHSEHIFFEVVLPFNSQGDAYIIQKASWPCYRRAQGPGNVSTWEHFFWHTAAVWQNLYGSNDKLYLEHTAVLKDGEKYSLYASFIHDLKFSRPFFVLYEVQKFYCEGQLTRQPVAKLQHIIEWTRNTQGRFSKESWVVPW